MRSGPAFGSEVNQSGEVHPSAGELTGGPARKAARLFSRASVVPHGVEEHGRKDKGRHQHTDEYPKPRSRTFRKPKDELRLLLVIAQLARLLGRGVVGAVRRGLGDLAQVHAGNSSATLNNWNDLGREDKP